MDKFWMVYLEGGNNPRRKHETYEAAAAEAERLARTERKAAYVLFTAAVCEPTSPPVAWTNLGGQ